MGGVWTARRLPFIVAGVTIAILLGVFLRTGPNQTRPTASKTDNWDQLCAVQDCSQFPMGYRTVQVGETGFYYPLTGDHDSWEASEHMFVERDEAGRPTRVVEGPRESIRGGYPCCAQLEERFGLKHPQKAGYSAIMEFWYDAPGQERAGGYGPFLNQARRLGRELPPFTSREALGTLDLPSFDGNFWLVAEGVRERNTTPGPRRLLISKQPLIFGRHVWMDCEQFCDAGTIVFADEPQLELPGIRVGGLREDRETFGVSPEPLAVVPETLAWVESLVRALQRKPADAPAP